MDKIAATPQKYNSHNPWQTKWQPPLTTITSIILYQPSRPWQPRPQGCRRKRRRHQVWAALRGWRRREAGAARRTPRSSPSAQRCAGRKPPGPGTRCRWQRWRHRGQGCRSTPHPEGGEIKSYFLSCLFSFFWYFFPKFLAIFCHFVAFFSNFFCKFFCSFTANFWQFFGIL